MKIISTTFLGQQGAARAGGEPAVPQGAGAIGFQSCMQNILGTNGSSRPSSMIFKNHAFALETELILVLSEPSILLAEHSIAFIL